MEDWEKSHITRNLVALTRDTICNEELFVHLMEMEALNQDEVDEIESKRTQREKASLLYRLLKTKLHGYKFLVDALVATNQTKPASLLGAPERAKRRLETSLKEYRLQEASQRAKAYKQNIKFRVPAPSRLFTGRCRELDRLQQAFKGETAHQNGNDFPQKVVCISGLGGIGKTQLARQFIHKNSAQFENIIWLNAEGEDSLAVSFRKLATDKLGLSTKNGNGTEKEIETVVSEVYEKLGNSTSLIVFDNAEKGTHIGTFFPNELSEDCETENSLCILITSRDTDWEVGHASHLKIKELEEEDALKFVCKGLNLCDENKDVLNLAQALVSKLQCFPLAIQQAIAYISEENKMSDYSIRNYLDEFENNEKDMLDLSIHGIRNDYQKTSFTTWKITMEKISKEPKFGSKATHILNCMAYLSPERIPRSMLLPLVPDKNERDLKRAVNLLVRYSMINEEDKQSFLSIHRLVQQVIRIELAVTGQDQDVWMGAFTPFRENGVSPDFVDHALSVWSYVLQFPEIMDEDIYALPGLTVFAMISALRESEALTFATGETGLKLLEKRLPSNDISVFGIELSICVLLSCRGLADQSLAKLQDIDEKSAGVSSPLLQEARYITAVAYLKKNDFKKSLEICLKILEEDKSEDMTNTSGNSLIIPSALILAGTCHFLLGNIENAPHYFKEALESASANGKANFCVMANYYLHLIDAINGNETKIMKYIETLPFQDYDPNIEYQAKQISVACLYLCGRLEEAQIAVEDLLLATEKYYDESHPSSIAALQYKGLIMRDLGCNLKEAVSIIFKMYKISLDNSGESSTTTLFASAQLALAWYLQDSSEEALFTIEEAVTALKKELGETDYKISWIVRDLAACLEKRGELSKSKSVVEEYMERFKSLGGSRNFATIKMEKMLENFNTPS